MDRERLESCWEKTLQAEVHLDELPTLVSYRPPDADDGLQPTLSSARFTPRATLGRGGMGVVLRARQESLGRDVALKTLESHANAPDARRNFIAEARVTGFLEHPNIVPVHDLGQQDSGAIFLAMKLVEGRTWQQLLDGERGGDLVYQLEILLQVCNAVAFAHSRSIVHNDLKPSNVLVGAFGEVVVADWGLAVSFSEQMDDGLRHRSSIVDGCGTPGYIAPEQALGEGFRIGPTTDVYLLGGVLYRILCGRPPHSGRRFFDVLTEAIEGRLKPFPDGLPKSLVQTCRRALAAEQEARFPSVEELAEAIRDYLRHRESLNIAEATCVGLDACRLLAGKAEMQASQLYPSLAEVVAGFSQARRLWAENPVALRGEQEARELYADAALARGDLALAQAQLEALRAHPDQAKTCAELGARLAGAHAARARERRTRRALVLGAALAALVAVAAVLYGLGTRRAARLEEQRARQAELAQLQAVVDSARQHVDLPAIEASITELRDLGTELESGLGEAARQAHVASLTRLLDYAAAEEDWLQVASLSLPGVETPAVPQEQRHARAEALFRHRRQALELAVALHSFDMAQVIAADTPEGARRAEWLADIEQARDDFFKARTALAAETLDALRDMPPFVENRLQREPIEFHASWLGSHRSEPFANFLGERLAVYNARAGGDEAQWSLGERLELSVLLRAFGVMRMPRASLGPLRGFLERVEDRRLLQSCADALASLRNGEAFRALIDHVLVRFGPTSSVWQAVAPALARIPAASIPWDEASVDDLTLRAMLHLTTDRPRLAQADVAAALAIAPDNPTALQLAAASCLAEGRVDAALETLEVALRIAPDDAVLLETRGWAQLQGGRPQEALLDFDRACSIDPKAVTALLRRGNAHRALGNREKALRDYRRATSLDPIYAEIFVERAGMYQHRGWLQAAVADLSWAVLSDGSLAQAWTELAHTLLRQGDPERAQVALDRAVELAGWTVPHLLIQTRLQQADGQLPRALETCARALEIAPDHGECYRARALLLLAAGDEEQALADLDRAIALAPELAIAHSNRAGLLLQRGAAEAAFAGYLRALEIDPMLAQAHYGLAQMYRSNGMPDEAILAAGRAVALDASFVQPLLLRANLRLDRGMVEAGLADLDRVLDLAPSNIVARLLRASLLYAEYDDALATLRDLQAAAELAQSAAARAEIARGLAFIYSLALADEAGSRRLPPAEELASAVAEAAIAALVAGAVPEQFGFDGEEWSAFMASEQWPEVERVLLGPN